VEIARGDMMDPASLDAAMDAADALVLPEKEAGGLSAVLATYVAQGRIHPAASHDAALDAVFAHWQQASVAGHDALMMARSRADVNRLNERAREAARAAGAVTGPEIRIGTMTWQAGDLLRTRRNDRRLPVGGSYVRNGERFRVLGPGPGGGLLVEDLAGRGRAALPPEYVARHSQRGWASTIDTAQGCTADVGVLLVRGGMDREHLYVGMSRGRLENHAHVAPEPLDDNHHLGPPPEALTYETARKILAGCLRRAGSQQAAHTVLAETQAIRQARSRTGPAHPVRNQPEPIPRADRYERYQQAVCSHEQAQQTYRDRLRDRDDLARALAWLESGVRVTEREIRDLPRFRGRGRRAELTTRLDRDRVDLADARARLHQLDHELPALQGDVEDRRAAVERERSRLEKPYKRPAEPSWARLPQGTGREPAPSQPEPHRSLARRLLMPGPENRGRGIEL